MVFRRAFKSRAASPHVQLLKHCKDNRISQTPSRRNRPLCTELAIYAIINKYLPIAGSDYLAAGSGHSSSIFVPRKS